MNVALSALQTGFEMNGEQHQMSEFAATIYRNKYAHTLPSGRKETWGETARRVAGSVMGGYMPALVDRVADMIAARRFLPGGRYLYAAGRKFPQVNNCFLFRAEDSREGWADTMHKVTSALMTGGGVGVEYSGLRASGSPVGGMGGTSTGPLALMQMVNEAGRHIMQGGSRRSAIWAGLRWDHPDTPAFLRLKDWPEEVRALKAKDFNFPAVLDGTNISVGLDSEFFAAHALVTHPKHKLAREVYAVTVRQMLTTAEPGFSVDYEGRENESLRNACTEVTSEDDSDCCNLGSANLARYDSLDQFRDEVPLMLAFLLCGTLYSVMPTERMRQVREKNRRLGLGLMGLHEWLIRRGYKYGPCGELGEWMDAYAGAGGIANGIADQLGVNHPVATRAIAPTGTISIVAETTSGVEPIFATAYLRRYLSGTKWKSQYVIDSTAARLIKGGADPALIEDAYTLAEDVERRVAFQEWLQRYVDQGISSTVNLPAWGSAANNDATADRFGSMLLKYLPRLRGITAYPDGCRGGQPLNRVSYFVAVGNTGKEFDVGEEPSETAKPQECQAGVCGA